MLGRMLVSAGLILCAGSAQANPHIVEITGGNELLDAVNACPREYRALRKLGYLGVVRTMEMRGSPGKTVFEVPAIVGGYVLGRPRKVVKRLVIDRQVTPNPAPDAPSRTEYTCSLLNAEA